LEEQAMKIRKGDQVTVVTGEEQGKRGRVKRVLPSANRVVVEGVNFVKRHRKPRGQQDRGGIVEFEAPIDASNVMIVCPRCKEPSRVGYESLPEGGKARVCRSCGEALD
jgi:large subunit ribosomal protein L24